MTISPTETQALGGSVGAAPESAAHDAKVVLRARGVSKRYERPAPPGAVRKLLAKLGGTFEGDDEDEVVVEEELDEDEVRAARADWVARDLDLELARRQSVGIVGPPGAGKTTLLKILAGIVPPSSGRVEANVLVLPLMDYLVKLMQDTTARRDVLLVARLVGLPSSLVRARMTEIFEFAELRGSENQARKSLTADQLRRLVAATMLHVDGGVLLVDSTFGELRGPFRDRCLAALQQRRRDGYAVVQTGREIESVRALCDEVIWLEEGRAVVRGRPDDVAAAVRQRRSETAPAAPRPTSECVSFLEYLRVAVGDARATDAYQGAVAAAAAAGAGRVDWVHVAAAIGHDMDEAGQIIDRLAARARKVADRRPVHNEHAAIVAARLIGRRGEPARSIRVDEEAGLQLRLEAATVGVEIRCHVYLSGEGKRRVRLDMPEPFSVDRPGLYRLETTLPAGALGEGRYRTTIVVTTSRDGRRSTIFRRDLLAFEVTSLPSDAVDDSVLDTLEAFVPDEVEDRDFEPLADLEWHVHAEAD